MKIVFKLALTALLILTAHSAPASDCCQSYEVGVGWRRDSLDWHSHIRPHSECSSSIDAEADSHFEFEKIDGYTLNGKAKFAGREYYIRLDADYGWTEKGRGEERMIVDAPFISPVASCTSNHIKRRSETYDFSAGFGYPFVFCDYCLDVIPLVGFSFHRQRLRVKDKELFFTSSVPSSLVPDGSSSSSSSDIFGSSGTFDSSYSFYPYSRTSSYRFTWYGPFLGVDIGYGLDGRWSLWAELEYHFGRCHRKRNSNTGFDFVDDYHHKGFAHGFHGNLGTTVQLCYEWYAGLYIDFDWWHSHNKRDTLTWKSVGANINIGRMY